jgi:hypothetical protein
MKAFLLTLFLCLLAPNAVFAQAPGDWVLGKTHGGKYWFPGVVESRSGNKIKIVFDDGSKDTLSNKQVRKYDWRVGSRVECLWAGGKVWYGGKIEKMGKDGSSISILYDDSGRENTNTGACRSK